MYYLAYGSNMAAARLQRRLPSAKRIGLVELPGHRLTFDNRSTKDHSGKCDALRTESVADLVLAVLYRIDPEEKSILDHYEGVGVEYQDVFIRIKIPEGEEADALIYYAINLEPGLRPYHWYKQHVLRGAEENGFPESYLQMIRQVESSEDEDLERCERELGIYL